MNNGGSPRPALVSFGKSDSFMKPSRILRNSPRQRNHHAQHQRLRVISRLNRPPQFLSSTTCSACSSQERFPWMPARDNHFTPCKPSLSVQIREARGQPFNTPFAKIISIVPMPATSPWSDTLLARAIRLMRRMSPHLVITRPPRLVNHRPARRVLSVDIFRSRKFSCTIE